MNSCTKGADMALSRYTLVFPCTEDPEYALLYSTKKASLIRIHRDTLDAADAGKISAEDLDVLAELSMITESRDAEKASMIHFLDDLTAKSDFVDITVVLNLDCNFACIYCFEEPVKGGQYMSVETADLLPGFIESLLTDHRKNLKITFYGGEPLLSRHLIAHISTPLINLAHRNGGIYKFGLVTNGALFTRKTAETLVPLGLSVVNTTLDGPPEVHNRQRPFKSGRESFDRLIKNMKETCDLVGIAVGGNYHKSNYREFVRLLDILESHGLTPDKILRVKFDPIIQQSEFLSPHQGCDMGCVTGNEPWVIEAEAMLREEILKRGYNTSKPVPRCCMVESGGAYVVNHDGKLYKCPGFIGINGFTVGDIRTGIDETKDPYKKGIWKTPECLACKYLPQCFGGCRYTTYLQTGSIDRVDCQKEGLGAALEGLIRQDMRYRSKGLGD
jgi:uncharacterized protein